MKEFKKSDLKDGMILIHRGNSHEEKLFFNGTLYWSKDNGDWTVSSRGLNYYTDDLCFLYGSGETELDIMKIEYMGETIWERKEYVVFDEARKSGKRIRYCGDLICENRYFDTISNIFRVLGCYKDEVVTNVLDDPMWEVEQ